MNKKEIASKIKELQGTDKINDLIMFMANKGFETEMWMDANKYTNEIRDSFIEYFNMHDEVAVESTAKDNISEDNKTEDSSPMENKDGINFEELNNKKKEGKKAQQQETKASIRRKYKVIDNLIQLTDAQETTLENVRYVTDTGLDEIYSIDISGKDIVSLYLNHTLVYDPSMQRGLVEDKEGNARANFNTGHINKIAQSIINGTFTPTQLHWAVITDDDSVETYDYDDKAQELFINGKLKLIDGQHRTRALVKVYGDIMTQSLIDIDISKYVFNVQIHVTTSEHAKDIYADINKNLKLDKSQVRHLGVDHYAKIVNALNQNSDSPLKDRIATSRRGNNSKLVLFNTLTDALSKELKDISSVAERRELTNYLIDFFDYVAFNLKEGFSTSNEIRSAFKSEYLLTENNFFPSWIALAIRSNKDNFKENIDKIITNKDQFVKNDEWLNKTVLKRKMSGEGYAMSNSVLAVNKMIEKTLEVAGMERKSDNGNVE